MSGSVIFTSESDPLSYTKQPIFTQLEASNSLRGASTNITLRMGLSEFPRAYSLLKIQVPHEYDMEMMNLQLGKVQGLNKDGLVMVKGLENELYLFIDNLSSKNRRLLLQRRKRLVNFERNTQKQNQIFGSKNLRTLESDFITTNLDDNQLSQIFISQNISLEIAGFENPYDYTHTSNFEMQIIRSDTKFPNINKTSSDKELNDFKKKVENEIIEFDSEEMKDSNPEPKIKFSISQIRSLTGSMKVVPHKTHPNLLFNFRFELPQRVPSGSRLSIKFSSTLIFLLAHEHDCLSSSPDLDPENKHQVSCSYLNRSVVEVTNIFKKNGFQPTYNLTLVSMRAFKSLPAELEITFQVLSGFGEFYSAGHLSLKTGCSNGCKECESLALHICKVCNKDDYKPDSEGICRKRVELSKNLSDEDESFIDFVQYQYGQYFKFTSKRFISFTFLGFSLLSIICYSFLFSSDGCISETPNKKRMIFNHLKTIVSILLFLHASIILMISILDYDQIMIGISTFYLVSQSLLAISFNIRLRCLILVKSGPICQEFNAKIRIISTLSSCIHPGAIFFLVREKKIVDLISGTASQENASLKLVKTRMGAERFPTFSAHETTSSSMPKIPSRKPYKRFDLFFRRLQITLVFYHLLFLGGGISLVIYLGYWRQEFDEVYLEFFILIFFGLVIYLRRYSAYDDISDFEENGFQEGIQSNTGNSNTNKNGVSFQGLQVDLQKYRIEFGNKIQKSSKIKTFIQRRTNSVNSLEDENFFLEDVNNMRAEISKKIDNRTTQNETPVKTKKGDIDLDNSDIRGLKGRSCSFNDIDVAEDFDKKYRGVMLDCYLEQFQESDALKNKNFDLFNFLNEGEGEGDYKCHSPLSNNEYEDDEENYQGSSSQSSPEDNNEVEDGQGIVSISQLKMEIQ